MFDFDVFSLLRWSTHRMGIPWPHYPLFEQFWFLSAVVSFTSKHVVKRLVLWPFSLRIDLAFHFKRFSEAFRSPLVLCQSQPPFSNMGTALESSGVFEASLLDKAASTIPQRTKWRIMIQIATKKSIFSQV